MPRTYPLLTTQLFFTISVWLLITTTVTTGLLPGRDTIRQQTTDNGHENRSYTVQTKHNRHLTADTNSHIGRSKCRLEMARLHGLMGQFQEAVTIYEEMGYQALESRLLKYSADEYLFRAVLCHLVIDW